MFEPAITDMQIMIESIIDQIKDMLDVPYILFGHSLGSRIAFELLNYLHQNHMQLPATFIASGSRGPQIRSKKEDIYEYDDGQFIAELKKLNGTPTEVLENKELMEMYIPLLRADFHLAYSYCFSGKTSFECPAWVFGGEKDVDVPYADLQSWQQFFNSDFNIKMFPGDHFFIDSDKEQLRQQVLEILTSLSN